MADVILNFNFSVTLTCSSHDDEDEDEEEEMDSVDLEAEAEHYVAKMIEDALNGDSLDHVGFGLIIDGVDVS